MRAQDNFVNFGRFDLSNSTYTLEHSSEPQGAFIPAINHDDVPDLAPGECGSVLTHLQSF